MSSFVGFPEAPSDGVTQGVPLLGVHSHTGDCLLGHSSRQAAGKLRAGAASVAELLALAWERISSNGPDWQPVKAASTSVQLPGGFFLAFSSCRTPLPVLLYTWLIPFDPSRLLWPELSPCKGTTRGN